MAEVGRRPWEDADNRALIDLWSRIGSIVLIALELDRSTSSVQTQASRLTLPRRSEGNTRHRRRWTKVDVEALRASVARFTRSDGLIPIIEIAEDVGRSIDTVAQRLSEDMGGEAALFAKLFVPKRVPNGAGRPGAVRKSRFPGRVNCLTCKKLFWSEGPHVRMCSSCRKGEGSSSDWDW